MTIDLSEDIRSLSDFVRRPNDFKQHLEDTGRALVLTVNGSAKFVVQDVAAYQELLDAVDRLEAIEGIRRGLDSVARGEGRPAAEMVAEFEAKYSRPENG